MALAVCGRIARSVIGREGLRSAAAAALFRPLVRSSSSQISSLQPSYVPKTSLSEPPWPEVKLPDTTEEAECHKELCKNVNTMIATGQYERLFAVVFLASRQWKVTNEDLILINSEMGAECGDKIHLEKVLLVGSDNFTLIGKPLLGFLFYTEEWKSMAFFASEFSFSLYCTLPAQTRISQKAWWHQASTANPVPVPFLANRKTGLGYWERLSES
uniref:Large ribosomal subunit protein bL21m n=1 Tax=Xenopus tropicalis TaxID=8364 RepID=A0A803KD37_XENTR